MKITNRFKVLSFFLIAAYLLAACGGTLPQSTASAKGPKVEANVVAFTGIVEAINGTQWTVGGQTLTLDPQVSLDPNIAVGDQVKQACPGLVLCDRLHLASFAKKQGGKVYRLGIKNQDWRSLIEFHIPCKMSENRVQLASTFVLLKPCFYKVYPQREILYD
ncbi:MAG TPA: hypothetical protein VF918_02040 [Anaerolineales bacterium]